MRSIYADQDIRRILWNVKGNYRVHKSQPGVAVLIQLNAVRVLSTVPVRLILTLPFYHVPRWFFPSLFRLKIYVFVISFYVLFLCTFLYKPVYLSQFGAYVFLSAVPQASSSCALHLAAASRDSYPIKDQVKLQFCIV